MAEAEVQQDQAVEELYSGIIVFSLLGPQGVRGLDGGWYASKYQETDCQIKFVINIIIFIVEAVETPTGDEELADTDHTGEHAWYLMFIITQEYYRWNWGGSHTIGWSEDNGGIVFG